MKCPSCEENTKDTSYCSNCSLDLKLYKQVHMMAVRLYNKGLEQAQSRCLSGAIDTLTMCIRLQKNHIDARNLLGLIYWEVGEIGQAIKHWIASVSYQEEDNIANDFLLKVQEDPSELARYSDTMVLYNKSLEYMSRGSEDMAIISLRKAISQNPNYIEAKALLSLYYITQKQEDKAGELLREILKINKDHPKANHYQNTLSPEFKALPEETAKAPAPRPPRVQPLAPRATNTMIQPKSLGGTILAFVLGAICMLGIYAILIMPSKTTDLKNEIKQAQNKELALYKELEDLRQEQDKTIKALQENTLTLEKANESLKQDREIQQLALDLQEARYLVGERQWLEAASKLRNINQENLQEETRAQYDQLLAAAYPKAAEQLYNQGYRSYQSKDYGQAIEQLEKSYAYAKEEWFSSNALYTIGRAYEDQENIEKANQYYQSVVDNYPGTKSASNAKRRIK